MLGSMSCKDIQGDLGDILLKRVLLGDAPSPLPYVQVPEGMGLGRDQCEAMCGILWVQGNRIGG